jgi:hypothetical protein
MSSDATSTMLEWFTDSGDPSLAWTNESRLRDSGWVEVRSNVAARWKEWKRGAESGFSSELEGRRAFQVVVKVVWPEEGADFDSLYEAFEADYAGLVAAVEGSVGTPAYSSEFDEPPLPMAGQFDRGTVWESERGKLAVSFQHEDKEMPLRLSFWLVVDHAKIEMDEWIPAYATKVVPYRDLESVWRSLDTTACYGFTWNDCGDQVIIASVYDDYSTVSIIDAGTTYDLAISEDDGWREAMVTGEWMPWPVRSILPRDLALEVLLKSDDFSRIRAGYEWRVQEG